MGKYSQYVRPPSYFEKMQKRKNAHPIWRGIGFLMMVIIPILAYFAAIYLLNQNVEQKWIAIPRDLLLQGADTLLGVKIGLTIVLVFIIYAILMMVSFIIYSLFGSERYGPLDVPPEKGPRRNNRIE